MELGAGIPFDGEDGWINVKGWKGVFSSLGATFLSPVEDMVVVVGLVFLGCLVFKGRFCCRCSLLGKRTEFDRWVERF